MVLLADKRHDDLSNYRVDRMTGIEILDSDASYNEIFIGKIDKGLTRWILQLGKDAKVWKPKILEDLVKEEILNMKNIYHIIK